METWENRSLTSTELQCLPDKNVGRRSVEVTKVVEEFCGPTDDSEGWENEACITTGQRPGCTRYTECVLNSVSSDSEDDLKCSVQQLTEERKFPEFIEHRTIMETKIPHKETERQRHAGGSRVEISTLGDKASRGSLFKKKADGYEAAFLRSKIRGAGKMSGSSAMTSPTESLEDILYRKTKHVFDYSVVDKKGLRAGQYSTNPFEYARMPPVIQSRLGAPSVTYSKRTEHIVTQSKVIRRREDSQHSLQVKVNKGWVDPEKRTYDSRVPTQRVDTASGTHAIRKSSEQIRKEKKNSYYNELNQQVQERRQMIERERRRNTNEERIHNETMQFGTWGKPGSGAPNPTAVRRTTFSSTGLISQEEIPSKGFAGVPFHLRF